MTRNRTSPRRGARKSGILRRSLDRFRSRFPRLLRTDFWTASRSRGLWTSIFGERRSTAARSVKSAAPTRKARSSAKKSPRADRPTRRYRKPESLHVESLEPRQLLTTTLGLGDMAITGYASDGNKISIALLKPVDAGTQFTVTDEGWLSGQSGFRGTTEGETTFQINSTLAAGTQISLDFANTTYSNGITSFAGGSDLPVLSSSGDQIFIYNGGFANRPTSGTASSWVTGFQMHGLADWDLNSSSSLTSAKPTIFTDGDTSFAGFNPEVDDAVLNNLGTVSGGPGDIRAVVYESSNWTVSDGPAPTIPGTTMFTVTGMAEQLVIDSSVFAAANGQVTIEVIGGDFVVYDSSDFAKTPLIPTHAVGSVTDIAVTGRDDADDALTLDGSTLVTGVGIDYDGGDNGHDTVNIDAATINFVKVEWHYSGQKDGDLIFDQDGPGATPATTVVYEDLEPVLVNVGSIADADFTLPAGAEAVLEDDGMGGLQLRSTNSTFELTGFTTPTNSLKISGGNKLEVTKSLSVAGFITLDVPEVSLDADLVAPTISGGTGTLAVHVLSNNAQIADAIAIAASGATVSVAAGTYIEDVNVNKALSLQGAGHASSTISGAIGGDNATVRISASGVEISGFTITREGNNVSQWNDSNLNSAGIAIIGQSLSGMLIHDNLITGNRTGIDINNSSGHTVRNNEIVDNHTGMIFRNQTDNLTIVENKITDNRTVGILFLDASGGSNSPVQTALNSNFSNNNISGNWYGGIVDRQSGGSLPAPGTTNLKNFSGNWFGANSPVITTANSAEPAYSSLIPVVYGGTATPPGGQPDIAGPASANFDISPLLDVGTDTDVETTLGQGTFGFQGSHSTLLVTQAGAQTGATGRIQEAVDSTGSSGTVRILAGTYVGNVDATSNAVSLAPGASPAQVTVDGDLTLDGDDTLEIEIEGTNSATQFDNFVVTGTATLGGAAVNVTGSYVPLPGDSFTMIDGAVRSGTFSTASAMLNGIPMSFSYTADDAVLLVDAPSDVWVDDDWVGTLAYGNSVSSDGDDGDDLVSGKIYGYNAFSDTASALTAVATGGTIHVLAGSFSGALSINKDVSIDGQSDALTHLDASSAMTGMDVLAGFNVTISDLDITNFSTNGIHVFGNLDLNASSIIGGLVGAWVDGGTLDALSTIISGAAIFGVQVSSLGDANISTSEITGVGTTAASVIVSSGHADILTSILTNSTRGLLVNATGSATIHDSNLAGNTVRGVENATAAVVDASGNWWGSSVEGTVAAGTLGLIDFTPYLDSGADLDSGARGFEADKSHVHVTKLGQQTSGFRVQEGVNLIADGSLTGGSRIVTVENGSYDETVLVNKSLRLQAATALGTQLMRTSGTQQTIVSIDSTDVTIDGLEIQVNQNFSSGQPIAPVGIGAVQTEFDGLTIENNRITSIGTSDGLWSGSPSLTTSAAGIVLYDSPAGGIPSVTIEDNQVSVAAISGAASFFQRAVWITQANVQITGNVFAGATNDLQFQFASGGSSLIDDNDFIGQHRAGGGGVVIAGPNTSAPITVSNNHFTPTAGDPAGIQTGLVINENWNGATSPVTVLGNTFTGDVIGVLSGNSNGLTIDGNTFTPATGLPSQPALGGNAFVHVVVDSDAPSGGDSASLPVFADIKNNTFNAATGSSGTAVVVADHLPGTFDDVKIGVNGDNTYDADLVTGVQVAGGKATISDTISNLDTAVLVSGGAANVTASTLTGNTTGVLVTGAGAIAVGSGNVVGGGTTGLKFDGAAVSLTSLDLNDLSISGTSGDYITLANSAFDNLDLDGTNLTLDGINVGSMTPPQLFAATNKITDEIDDGTLGLVLLTANTIYVTPAATPTATDNDYTRIKNAVEAAGDNFNIYLLGTFDWTETNAAASWALGNDGVSGGGDDFSIRVPVGLDGVTFTALGGIGGATILGPGEQVGHAGGMLAFRGGPNTGWTISDLDIQDFENAIGFFYGAGGNHAYDNTTITGNHILVPSDFHAGIDSTTNDDIEPGAGKDINVAIHLSFGDNITVSNNVIGFPGTGVSDSGNGNYANSQGILSDTNGAAYEGLQISGNIFNVLGAQSADPEVIIGVWDNGHAHTKNITISGNEFHNLDSGNDPTLNLQRAFRVTSHSGTSSTVTYSNNTVDGANVGWQWLSGENFAGNQPVQIIGNTLTNVRTGFLVQSNGLAHFSDNSMTNTGAMLGVGTGIDVRSGSIVDIDDSTDDNGMVGFATGIKTAGTTTISGNGGSIHGNAVGIDVTAGTAAITGNHIYDNDIGIRFGGSAGGSVTGNDFDGATDNDTDLIINTTGVLAIGAGNSFAGDSFLIDNQSTQSFNLFGANAQTFDEADNFRIEDKMHHPVDSDDTSAGLIYWVEDNVYVTTPSVGSTDSSIQGGINAANTGDTINVEMGTYVENLAINKNLTLLSASGRTATTIQGISGAGALGTIVISGSTTDVNIGGPLGGGFVIQGIDNGLAGIENGAIYISGSHSGMDIRWNEVVANGDHGLVSEYSATIASLSIDHNIFSGQTFTGPNPGGAGFGAQFTLPNVPRQLVVFGNSALKSDIDFSNNQINGTAGGISLTDNSGAPVAAHEQGNVLVTIDATGTMITGNQFTGTTTSTAYSLRARGANNTITGNQFASSTMGTTTADLMVNNNGNAIRGNTFSSSAGAAIQISGGSATIGGSGMGETNFITGYDAGVLVTAGNAILDSNSIAGGTVGLWAAGGKIRAENNDLTGNLVGIRVQNDATVDAGSDNGLDGDPTSLGNSIGQNILVGYSGVGGNYAIEDLNQDALGNVDVYARNNNFGTANPSAIEQVVFHTVDDAQYTQVFYTPAINPPGQTPPPVEVWVDDDWIGTGLGVDADPGDMTDGTFFGYDQFTTIQEAVNAVIGDGTGIVHVRAGSYYENVDVNKSVLIDGAGQTNTFVYPAVANPTGGSLGSVVLLVNEDNITIQGLTVDGDNPNLGAMGSIEASTGIVTNWNQATSLTGMAVKNVTVQNVYLRGIYYANGNDFGTGAFDFEGNTVTNVKSDPASIAIFNFGGYGTIAGNTVSDAADAIATNWSNGTEISGNTVTNSGSGVHSDNNGGAGGVADSIHNNDISLGTSGSYGIFVFVPYKDVTVENNQISGVDTGLAAFGGMGGSASFTGNTVNVNAGGTGAYVTTDTLGYGQMNASATFSGGNFTGGDTGILVEENMGATATVGISGVTIDDPLVGIDVTGGGVTIDGNHIYNNATGIRVSGGTATIDNNNFAGGMDPNNATDLLVTGGTIGNGGVLTGNTFAGSNFYIDLQTTQDLSALTPSNTFQGAADDYRIEDKMHHRVDTDLALSNGLVSWVTNNLYITQPGGGSLDSSIQRGVDALPGGHVVNVEGGVNPYVESVAIDRAVTIDGQGNGPTPTATITAVASGVTLVNVVSTNPTDDVAIQDIAFAGVNGGNVADLGVNVPASANFDTLTIDRSTFTSLHLVGAYVQGDGVTGASAHHVVISNSTFTNNGYNTGGAGDIGFFLYNQDASLSHLTLSNDGALGARLGIQFRGVGAGDGTGVIAMGAVSLDDVKITGKYRTQFVGIQRYSDVTTLTLNDVELGGASSEITGGFGALLRFDAVGSGTLASPATVDLGNTYFHGVAASSAVKNDLEFAPDNTFAFLRADATNTRWDTATDSGVAVPAASLTIAQAYEVEDRILHYVEPDNSGQPAKGWAEVQDGQAFVTSTFGSIINRAIEVVDDLGTVHIASGTYTQSVSTAGKSVTLSVGASPGVVTINGDVTLDSDDTLLMEVNGSTPTYTPGVDHDQWVVNGVVTLGGAVLNTAGSGVTATQGDVLTLIDNDSNDSVGGTFAGVANGDVILVNGEPFFVFYTGGTGNDVVLARAPDGTLPGMTPAPTVVFVDDDWSSDGDGVDADGATGNVVANWDSMTLTGGLAGGVANGTAMGYDQFDNIQDAVNAVAAGGTIFVYAGSYVQQITVDRALTLFGAQAGQDARTRSTTPADETVVLPDISDPDPNNSPYPTLIYVEVGGVKIDGLTLDGDNPNLTSGVMLNGADIDAEEGIASYEGVGNITVENNIVHNFSYTGIDFYNFTNDAATSNNLIAHNLIQNLGAFDWGIGVLIYNNFYADIVENKIEDVRVGVQTGNFYQANPGATANISENEISARRRGIFYNLHYANASPFTVEDNAITAVDDPSAPINTTWAGMLISSQQTAVSADFINNTIDGSATTSIATTAGYNVWNTPTTGSLTISGGSVSGVGYGVWVNNYEGYNSDADNTDITISGVNVTAELIGVYVLDSASNTNGSAVSATIDNDTEITTTDIAGVGIKIEGADASATITGNDNSIHDNQVGIDVDGGKALVENNDLNGNTIGALIQNGGIADLGDQGTNFTGLGISAGGNDFSSYTAAATALSGAIVNLNTGGAYSDPGPQGFAGPEYDVAAFGNLWNDATPAGIENVVWHDADDSSLGFIDYASLTNLVIDDLSMTPIDENDVVTLNVSFTNDAQDHTLTINWGDGVTDVVHLVPGVFAYPAMHTYLDDGPYPGNGTSSDANNVSVTVQEGWMPATGAMLGDSTSVTVNNVAPQLTSLIGDTINEGGLATITTIISDPGTQDVFSINVDWQDGTLIDTIGGLGTSDASGTAANGTGYVWVAATRSLTLTHTYLDDGPSPGNATSSDLYVVGLSVDDDDLGNDSDTVYVTVDNVDPVIDTLNIGSPINEFTSTTLGGTYHDDGTLDVHQLDIDWDGDNVYDETVPVSGGTFSVNHTYNVDGVFTVNVQLRDDDLGAATGSTSITVINDTLRVISFSSNASGFDVTFNRAPNLAPLNLYSGLPGGFDPADVTLVGNSVGNVSGSMVWEAGTKTLHFIKTSGILANDTYTVTLVSGSTAFHDAFGKLDGDGDLDDTEVPDDYTNSFAVNVVVGTRVVEVNDFARGTGQHVDDNPTVVLSRLAVSVSNRNLLRSIDFNFRYDPALLNVAGASLVSGLPGDWQIVFSGGGNTGVLHVVAFGVTPLAGGDAPIVLIDASVPNSAAYGASEVMRITDLTLGVDDGMGSVVPPAETPIGDFAVHKNVYLGDADGDGFYSGFDAAYIARTAPITGPLDTGYYAHDWTDPVIVGDVDGNGVIQGIDASIVAQKSVFLPTPQIPNLPGLPLTPVGGGIDPLLSIDDNIPINLCGVLVPVKIDSPVSLPGLTFVTAYDASAMDFHDATQGAFWSAGSGWSIIANEPTPGTIYVTMYRSTVSPPGNGTIANLQFHVELTTPMNTYPVTVDISNPGQGDLTWTHDDGSVVVDTNPAFQPGDFDGDSDVDGADFVIWQTHFPMANGAMPTDGDGDCDGDVDGADFVIWQTHFPTAPGPGAAQEANAGEATVASGQAATGSTGQSAGDASGAVMNYTAGNASDGAEAADWASGDSASDRPSSSSAASAATSIVLASSASGPTSSGAIAEEQQSADSFVSTIDSSITADLSTSSNETGLIPTFTAIVASPTVETAASVSTASSASTEATVDGDNGASNPSTISSSMALSILDKPTVFSATEGYGHSANTLRMGPQSIAELDELFADALLDPTDEACNELAEAVCEDTSAKPEDAFANWVGAVLEV
ncbi:MAG: right-handed parallel beta-helix repeat-containing protein [Pirellulales bacterium]|nr:right-handed parallel beta-helix repeat-containing protein [Pirellulales bacterium]